jgi:ferric iron reductase protein FhuF
VTNASPVTKWDIGLATAPVAYRVVQRHQDLDLVISAIHVVTQATGPTTAQGARINNDDEDEHGTFTSHITSYESLLYLDITKSCLDQESVITLQQAGQLCLAKHLITTLHQG